MNTKNLVFSLSVTALLCLSACGGKNPPDHRDPMPHHDSALPATVLPQSNSYATVEYADPVSRTYEASYVTLKKEGNRYVADSDVWLPSAVSGSLHVEVGLPKMDASADASNYQPTMIVSGYEEKTLPFQNAQLNTKSDQVVYSTDLINALANVPSSETSGVLKIHFDSASAGEEGGMVEIPFVKLTQN
jgi:hypothetical protein